MHKGPANRSRPAYTSQSAPVTAFVYHAITERMHRVTLAYNWLPAESLSYLSALVSDIVKFYLLTLLRHNKIRTLQCW